MAEGFLSDQDGNEIADQDSNFIEVYGLSGIRISKIGNLPYTLELPENNISWFNKADKSNVLQLNQIAPFTPINDYEPTTKLYVDTQKSLQDRITLITTNSYSINEIDKTILVNYPLDKVNLYLPSASLLWDEDNQSGVRFLIKDIGCNAFYKNIIINADGSDTIIASLLSQSSIIIDSNGGAVWIQAISTTQFIVY